MSGYGEPEWLSAGNDNKNQQVTEEANTGGNMTAPPPAATATTSGKGGCALVLLSILGMGLAGMMCALGILTLIEVNNRGKINDFSEPFLAAYMVLFSVLLFTYEVMWWTPVPTLNRAVRKNFGFMYGLRGKGLYLIFVACLCIGLGDEASLKALNWATGISFLAVGLLHWFVICWHPDLAGKYVAPTAGLLGEETTTPAANENVV
mmetsp:Transcript_82592/g.239093  ORF Transcript_82592/g.239093 Transcript_82592/m.239093 type:complete len:206 (+) Transcript_82592:118-735(+)